MALVETVGIDRIASLLGASGAGLLEHHSKTIARETLHLPGPDFVDRVWAHSDRPIPVLRNLQALFGTGRLANTGYLSILPVDQGIEHSAGASFAPNPQYFDPENIVKLAIEGGCNAVASTYGVLGIVARKYAHQIPFIVKINHNEFLTYPNKFDQIMFGTLKSARDMGAAAVGATIYFGSPESGRQIVEVAQAFAMAHDLGMATVLWCYLRNPAFKIGGVDYHVSADLTGQANHLGVTIEADIIKQKLPENNGGYNALNTKDTVRQDQQEDLQRAHERPPDRPHPLPGGQLLHGPRRPDQLGRRVERRRRPGRGREDRRDQQARRRHGPHLGPQGVPAADGRGRRAAPGDPGRLPLQGRHDRVRQASGPGLQAPGRTVINAGASRPGVVVFASGAPLAGAGARRPEPQPTRAMHFTPAHPSHPDARALIEALDADIEARYPGVSLEPVDTTRLAAPDGVFLVGRHEGRPVACGGIRAIGPHVAEVKRMYVDPSMRRQGVARALLAALEDAARERGSGVMRIETGERAARSDRAVRARGLRTHSPVRGVRGKQLLGVFREEARAGGQGLKAEGWRAGTRRTTTRYRLGACGEPCRG